MSKVTKKNLEKVANLVAMDVAKNIAAIKGKALSVSLDQEKEGDLLNLTITVNDERIAREIVKHVLESPKYLFVDLDGYDVNCRISLNDFLKEESKFKPEKSIEDLFNEACKEKERGDKVFKQDKNLEELLDEACPKQEESKFKQEKTVEELSDEACPCCGCPHDEDDYYIDDEDDYDDDWDDDEDYDEDWDDDDYEEEPELEKVYPKTIDGVWVLYIMNPHIEEGKLIADPYVGPDFKVATGHSYQEVAEKYASDIAMTHASGYETAILMPSHEELAKMLVKGNEYLPRVKAIYEGHVAYGKVADVLLRGTAIPDEVVDKIVEAAKCMKELDPDDNYHA